MLFNSFEFALFLPIVFIIYWTVSARFRWVLLLLSSYYFYMSWNPKYVVLIAGTTLVSYFAAILIEKCSTKRQKRGILILSAITCLGVLFVFKYLNFALDVIYTVMSSFAIPLSEVTVSLILPVGISFYTFQTLSYVIDVYRGTVKAEKHLGYYATFISFFPQLVAGPIERTENLLPQIKKTNSFDEEKAMDGVKRMLWGYYKKLVVADAVGLVVDSIYEKIPEFRGGVLLIAIFLFTIQIYCDFSGYSDIAIGTAKLLGIDLMDNFKSPYFATSIRDFWSRWHISLSTWFRDYVYIPLGGNRKGKLRKSINLLITFSISGLWHGANWTFIFWGLVHGMGQVIEDWLKRPLDKMRKNKLLTVVLGFFVFVFVNFAWVLFRANSLDEALYIYSNVFVGITNPVKYAVDTGWDIGWKVIDGMYYVIIIGILAVVDFLDRNGTLMQRIKERKKSFQWTCYIVLAIITFILAQKGEVAEFVYFQF